MTLAFDKASALVFATGGDLDKEQMKMFDWLAEAFSYEEQTELELDLRSVIHQRQEEPDAKINA